MGIRGCILPGLLAGLATTRLLPGLGHGDPIEPFDTSTWPDAVGGSFLILVAWRAVSDRR